MSNYEEMRACLDEFCAAANRDLASPECTLELAARIAVTLPEVERKLREIRLRGERECKRWVRAQRRALRAAIMAGMAGAT
jgi:hypothetical protein